LIGNFRKSNLLHEVTQVVCWRRLSSFEWITVFLVLYSCAVVLTL